MSCTNIKFEIVFMLFQDILVLIILKEYLEGFVRPIVLTSNLGFKAWINSVKLLLFNPSGILILKRFLASYGLVLSFLFSASNSYAVDIYNLGTLQGDNSSYANGVSAEGTIVVGSSYDTNGISRAFIWNITSGLQTLGTLPGDTASNAWNISADGTVVVGESRNGNIYKAVQWTSPSGILDLGTLPGTSGSVAWNLSPNGSVVVGNTRSTKRAFRWTSNSGMSDLGTLPGDTTSAAFGASADGSIVVGRSDGPTGDSAFRWTFTGGMEKLGAGVATDVNYDGSVIVGNGNRNNGLSGIFRWTATDGMVNLPSSGGIAGAMVGCISSDGSVIFGGAGIIGKSGTYAYRWSSIDGFVDLNTWLPTKGINLSGWVLNWAWGCSSDGNVIVGQGTYNGNTRAFVAIVPEPSTYILGTFAAGLIAIIGCCSRNTKM